MNPVSILHQRKFLRPFRREGFIKVMLFAGIFLFPVLYQPVHIIRHHSHERSDHACEHHHHTLETAAGVSCITQTQNHCLICEYEFVIKDLPAASVLVNAPFQYYELKPAPVLSFNQTLRFFQINPRGPPQS